MFLLPSFRNTISLPKRPLSDCQMKQQILEKEILYLQFPTLNLLGSRYAEACKWNNGLKDLQKVALHNTLLVPLFWGLITTVIWSNV